MVYVVNALYHPIVLNVDIKMEQMMLNVLNARMIFIYLMENVINVNINLILYQVVYAIITIVLVSIIIKIIIVNAIIIMY